MASRRHLNARGFVYSIILAEERHLDALPQIERAAARLLEGHAPESVLETVTERHVLAEAIRQRRLWVALAGGSPVGFAHVEMLAPDWPHLAELDVHPSHGRRGVGAALVKTVCEWAIAAGFPEVTLTTFRAVPFNMPFYARLGFDEVPRDAWRPEMVAVVANETARGLTPPTRVVMAYRTT